MCWSATFFLVVSASRLPSVLHSAQRYDVVCKSSAVLQSICSVLCHSCLLVICCLAVFITQCHWCLHRSLSLLSAHVFATVVSPCLCHCCQPMSLPLLSTTLCRCCLHNSMPLLSAQLYATVVCTTVCHRFLHNCMSSLSAQLYDCCLHNSVLFRKYDILVHVKANITSKGKPLTDVS